MLGGTSIEDMFYRGGKPGFYPPFTSGLHDCTRTAGRGNFVYGYKLGLLMTAEAFITGDELFGE